MQALEGTLKDFHAIIPAGGVGSRLWPLSRAEAPKFLHDLTGSGHTLLRDTWNRVLPLAGSAGIFGVSAALMLLWLVLAWPMKASARR